MDKSYDVIIIGSGAAKLIGAAAKAAGTNPWVMV